MADWEKSGELSFIDACTKYLSPYEVQLAEKIVRWLDENGFSAKWETNGRNPSKQNMGSSPILMGVFSTV